jgi:hypothetical protein
MPEPDDTPSPPSDASTPPPGWFERHAWKLLLVVIGFVALSMLSCCGGVGYMVWQLFRSKAVYELSVSRAESDPRVVEAMGEPIEAGWFMQGSINIEDGRGHASLRIPMNGSKHRGDILSQAVRRDGRWRLRYLAVEADGREERIVVVDRRNEPLEGEPPPPLPPPADDSSQTRREP